MSTPELELKVAPSPLPSVSVPETDLLAETKLARVGLMASGSETVARWAPRRTA